MDYNEIISVLLFWVNRLFGGDSLQLGDNLCARN